MKLQLVTFKYEHILFHVPVTPDLIVTLIQFCYSALVFHSLLIPPRGKETEVDSPYKCTETLE
jgi:hypothetical protein